MKKYVVFWNPLNDQGTTVNLLVEANSEEEAIAKASKVTKSKAKKYVTEYKPKQQEEQP